MWDLIVVGAGPAGSAAALGALRHRPDAKVLLLDRADFPRDKSCGDGIAPHVFDTLADVGVTHLLDDWTPVHTLALEHRGVTVTRDMARPTWVVPRSVFDKRLLDSATERGAVFLRHRVRKMELTDDGVVLDDTHRARVLVAADGANSQLRKAIGLRAARRTAIAIRGYAPTQAAWATRQAIVFGASRQPSYAWAFDRGDGFSNVGYGEVLSENRTSLTRKVMLRELEALLPGSAATGDGWLAHHLPLSSWHWQHPGGRVLLAGDAAGLINPMTGEGIYYAVATGVMAGTAAVETTGAPRDSAGSCYRSAVRTLLGRHLKHTAVGSWISAQPRLLDAGLRAAAKDQGVFDAIVEVGLGRGRLTLPVLAGLAHQRFVCARQAARGH